MLSFRCQKCQVPTSLKKFTEEFIKGYGTCSPDRSYVEDKSLDESVQVVKSTSKITQECTLSISIIVVNF